jgi:hypothetical protein
MLLAAVAQELVPPLSAADHVHDIIAILVGFSMGVGLMIGLEFIVSDPEEEEGQEMKENILPIPAQNEESVYPRDVPVFARSPSERSLTSSGAGKKSKAFASFRINERSGKASAKIVIPPFPIAFAAAVYIDSAMDGVVCPSAPIPTRSTTQAHARKYRLKALMHTQVNSLPTSKRMRAHALTQACRMHSYMPLLHGPNT